MSKIKSKDQLDMLLKICDPCGNGNYISKEGTAYIEALKIILSSRNTNDNPFNIDDILEQPLLKDFKFTGVKDFKYICKLKADPMIINKDNLTKTNEKIRPLNFSSQKAKDIFYNSIGIVYILTCQIDSKEYIIKIGSSRNTFNNRLDSYNCGTVTNRKSGSASTTNYRILQSLVATKKEFNLYLLDFPDDPTPYEWYGITSPVFPSSRCFAYEYILINQYMEQFNGKKPLGNIQTKLMR